MKPKTLKEAIILVLQEAGPGGLTLREIVQRIKKKKWWDWKDDEAGYHSVSGMCSNPKYRDVFVSVAPGTWALLSLQDDDFDPNEKPKTLKEAIIRVLQEAGPGGLTVKEIVQRIKKKKWWDWKNDKQGYVSVLEACRAPSNGDVVVRVAPGVYALWALQDDDFTPYVKPVKPMTLKEAIIHVLEEAGPKGLKCNEIAQRIKEDKLWDWENEKQGPSSVSDACCKHPDVFIKHSRGVYALRSLQEGEEEAEGSSKALAKEKSGDVERTASGAKRAREAADGSADESNQITATTTTKKKKKKVVEEPQSDAVPVEDRRLLLYTNEQREAADEYFERALERARAKRSAAGSSKEI